MPKNRICLAPDLGHAVIEHLTTYAKLPRQGLVAGQAACSAVLDLLGEKGGGIYNDIDVFRARSDCGLMAGLDAQDDEAFVPALVLEPGFGDYGELNYMGTSPYRLIASGRSGRLNVIDVSFAVEDHLDVDLLKGFDINCVQVGVNLETRELFWTPEFEDFIHTKQLELVTLHSPANSLLRLLRKRDAMVDVYLDVEKALQTVLLSGLTRQTTGGPWVQRSASALGWAPELLGPARATHFHTYRRELEASFELVPFEAPEQSQDAAPLQWMRPRGLPSSELLAKADFIGQGWPLSEHDHLLAAELTYGSRRQSVVKRYESAASGKAALLRDAATAHGMQFFEGNIALSEVKWVDKFLSEHRIPLHFLNHFSKWLEGARLVHRLAKEFGLWVFGSFETGEVHLIEVVGRVAALRPYDTLRLELAEVSKDAHRILRSALYVGRQFGDFRVTELVTRAELCDEGARMRHCVGGYARGIDDGYRRIFSLKTGPRATDCSTLELYGEGAPQSGQSCRIWHLGQHKTFANEPPPQSHLEFATWLLREVNRQQPGYHLAVLRKDIQEKLRKAQVLAGTSLRKLRGLRDRAVRRPGDQQFDEMLDSIPF